MFEVGFTEIVLILGIALLVLGPQRLPKLAADVGRWAGKARAMARQLRSQLEQEAGALNEIRKPLDDLGNMRIDSPSSPRPTPAAQPTATAANPPTATPDVTDESKPG
jgi:Tat protein translocase TatB subunit